MLRISKNQIMESRPGHGGRCVLFAEQKGKSDLSVNSVLCLILAGMIRITANLVSKPENAAIVMRPNIKKRLCKAQPPF